jgi:hypothetical protein
MADSSMASASPGLAGVRVLTWRLTSSAAGGWADLFDSISRIGHSFERHAGEIRVRFPAFRGRDNAVILVVIGETQ